jgi:UDP-N-acetylglucosamine acyltransferase
MIHPTATIDSSASIDSDVVIGHQAYIGPNSFIASGCHIHPFAVILGNTHMESGCQIYPGAVLGGEGQHMTAFTENSCVKLGAGVKVREFATIHRGVHHNGITQIGEGSYIMAYAHVGHDVQIGKEVVIANQTQIGGESVIEDFAFLGAGCLVHQFSRVGTLAIAGFSSVITQDIPPYTMATQNPATIYGLNTVGMKRRKVPLESRSNLQRCLAELMKTALHRGETIQSLKHEFPDDLYVQNFLEFIETSKRGVRFRPSHRSSSSSGASPSHRAAEFEPQAVAESDMGLSVPESLL